MMWDKSIKKLFKQFRKDCFDYHQKEISTQRKCNCGSFMKKDVLYEGYKCSNCNVFRIAIPTTITTYTEYVPNVTYTLGTRGELIASSGTWF